MKKVFGILAFLLIIITAIAVFLYNSPDVFIAISKPVDEENPMYFTQITVGGNGRFGLPIPTYIKERLNDIDNKAFDVEQEIFQKYESAHINTEINIEDGKTVLIYSGTGINKKTQKPEKYYKKIVFDYIATKTILYWNVMNAKESLH